MIQDHLDQIVPGPSELTALEEEATTDTPSSSNRRHRVEWARLLARVFQVDGVCRRQSLKRSRSDLPRRRLTFMGRLGWTTASTMADSPPFRPGDERAADVDARQRHPNIGPWRFLDTPSTPDLACPRPPGDRKLPIRPLVCPMRCAGSMAATSTSLMARCSGESLPG